MNDLKERLIEIIQEIEEKDPERRSQHRIDIVNLDSIPKEELCSILDELVKENVIDNYYYDSKGTPYVSLKKLRYFLLDNSSGNIIKELVVITTKLPMSQKEIKEKVKKR